MRIIRLHQAAALLVFAAVCATPGAARTPAKAPAPITAMAKFTIPHLPLSQVDVPPRLIVQSPMEGLDARQALQAVGEDGCAVGQHIVDTHGSPREVPCVRASDAKLARAAVKSVRHYWFHPATKGGKVVATETQQRSENFALRLAAAGQAHAASRPSDRCADRAR